MSDAAKPIAVTMFGVADGTRIAWREIGEGRALLLIHGFFSDAITNWMKFTPTAQRLADAGFRVIMPDLRGHGSSDRPHDPAAYPLDILADDQIALLDHLGITDYDLAGYSLGARTAARLLARGAGPRRAILSGMGLAGLTTTGTRKAYFRNILTNIGTHARGSAEWLAEAFLKSSGGDAIALNLLLDSFVDTPIAALQRFDLPIGVVCGSEDDDNGSAADLAACLPQGKLITVPGTHMSAVTRPELGEAFVKFLT